MGIGATIREIRKSKSLTQVEVAEKAGISVNSLRLYEAEKRKPNIEQLRKIAFAVGVTVSDLVDGDYWSKLSNVEKLAAFASNPNKELLLGAFNQLNNAGQQKAVERVEELTEIPKYQKEPPQD